MEGRSTAARRRSRCPNSGRRDQQDDLIHTRGWHRCPAPARNSCGPRLRPRRSDKSRPPSPSRSSLSHSTKFSSPRARHYGPANAIGATAKPYPSPTVATMTQRRPQATGPGWRRGCSRVDREDRRRGAVAVGHRHQLPSEIGTAPRSDASRAEAHSDRNTLPPTPNPVSRTLTVWPSRRLRDGTRTTLGSITVRAAGTSAADGPGAAPGSSQGSVPHGVSPEPFAAGFEPGDISIGDRDSAATRIDGNHRGDLAGRTRAPRPASSVTATGRAAGCCRGSSCRAEQTAHRSTHSGWPAGTRYSQARCMTGSGC